MARAQADYYYTKARAQAEARAQADYYYSKSRAQADYITALVLTLE